MLLVIFTGCAGDEESRAGIPEDMVDSYRRADPASLPRPSGGFVYSIKGETITAEEIVQPLVEQFKEAAGNMSFQQFRNAARTAVERRILSEISDVLVHQQAVERTDEQIDEAINEAVQKEVRKFVMRFGGDYARAERALKDMGMNWQQFREQQKKVIMTQSYLASEMPEQKPVTPGEVQRFYENNKDRLFGSKARIRIQLIDIQPAKLEVSDPNLSRAELAEEKAEELLSQLRAGEDFTEIAREHSHGYRAGYGGKWEPVNPDSLAPPYDILAEKAIQMQVGDVEGHIFKGGHYFILKLLEKQETRYEPLSEVREQIQARLHLQRRREAIREFNRRVVEQAALSDINEFTGFCLQQLYLMCNQ